MTALHVTNGESVCRTLRALGREALSWDDVLHEGPVPALDPVRLREVRARFLGGCGSGEVEAISASLAQRDARFEEALRGGRVVLWFEHDLHDQLELVQILERVGEVGGDSVELIQVGCFPGRPSFRGLGELTADELDSLFPLRRPLAAATLAAAAAAWDALRAPDPLALEALAGRDLDGFPFLAPALTRLLEELPAVGNGLARSERQLLEALAEGALTPFELFVRAQEPEEAPYRGDTWFFRQLETLRPLVEKIGERVRITEAGRRVLDGDADLVELMAVDRWLGGTHLAGGDVWRWDPARRRVVAPG